MNIDLREELRKRDELLDGYLKQIEIQEEFIQKQKEAADAHKETIRVRNYWFQVLEDMLAHVLRYLKGSMDNEPDRTWNKDMHSLVQEMVRMGEIKPEEARNHPDKNIITRALGAEKTVDVDFFDMRLEPGSTILMCSDGLSNMVEDKKMEEIILNSDEDITWKGNTLIQEANNNGGKDNIAIILIEPFTNEVETC